MSETYEVWHFDGKRPELLSGGHADKGACRRVWCNCRHAAIVRDGVVLEPKPSCDGRRARAIASAAGEAHRTATGRAPEMAPRGVPAGDGKRLAESASPALRALDAAPPLPPEEVIPEVEVRERTELPRGVVLDPPRVRRREPRPSTATPAPVEPPMPSTSLCPCGEPSAPTAATRRGGRPSRPEDADLCSRHRTAALGRRSRGATPAEARAATLAAIRGEPPEKRPAKRPGPTKPARRAATTPKALIAAAEVPMSDLLALVRRQRAVVDSLGGIAQAERVAAMVVRVGGPVSLVALVEELSR